ncbi:MAG: MscS Mechanosensitive ion channel [Clostridiales bacterium]|nr:MscS Mechanosensitive ion channel [Clostridiales bacterium]
MDPFNIEEVFLNLREYYYSVNLSELLLNLLWSAIVLVVTHVIILIGKRLIDRVLAPKEGQKHKLNENLAHTIRVLLKTLLLYGGYFFAIIIILEIFQFKVITPEDLKSIGTKIVTVIVILVGARLAVNFSSVLVEHIFEDKETELLWESNRAQTLIALTKSLLKYAVFFIAGIMILETFGVDTSAILASAGILGLAVGFGAQSLVQDVISGFFIIFEDQFTVGDYVEAGEVTGVVEEVGLRTTKIRRWTGHLEIIPNGSIKRVTNYNRGHMLALVTVGIAYEEDIDKAIEVLRQAGKKAYEEMESIVEEPVVQGVTQLADSSVNIRTIATTLPGEQWAVERELLRRFKYALDEAGIEIPYPRRVLYTREEE